MAPDTSNLPRYESRPPIVGRQHAVSTGHWLATVIANRILDEGGNAIDAGVAAGIALSVLQPDLVQFAGVAPIILYDASGDEVVTISGLGRWPRRASLAYFEENVNEPLPRGYLLSVVPASIDAWLTALERYGTRSFADVAGPAMELAREGFPVHRLLEEVLSEYEDIFSVWPSTAAVLLPNKRPPKRGERLRQSDLARTIERLISAEAAAGSGRREGLQAVRSYFYEGPIAKEIDAHYREHGALLTYEDMRDFHVTVEPAVSTTFAGHEVYSCGPWCQGPMLLEFLNLVEPEDLAGMEHNQPAYIHLLTELMKLGFADREAYFGDPDFIDVPLDELLSKDYAAERRRLFRRDKAWPDMPPQGDVGRPIPSVLTPAPFGGATPRYGDLDTTYLCVVDRWGNVFSATPSDGCYYAPIVPGLGCSISPRGANSWLVEGHPSAVAPWKRPRLTPSPALVLKDKKPFMVFGSPGADIQCQVMLQTFLNVAVFGMDVQSAIDAPRFSTSSFPGSFMPHVSHPGVLTLESELAHHAGALSALGHTINHRPYRHWRGGGVCAISIDKDTGHLTAGADPRRECYALAW